MKLFPLKKNFKKNTLLQLKGDYFPNYLHRGSFTVWVLHLQNRSSVSEHTEAVDCYLMKKKKQDEYDYKLEHYIIFCQGF